ncbi:MAG: 2Fe-2S iron-sulfur cluster-binding protein [Quisquiliibacterium sp.]
MTHTAILRIQRGGPGQTPAEQDFEVRFDPGQSLLDGLRQVRARHDPTLAFRFSCINANACKECMMKLDGKTVYACTARLEARVMRVAPLPNKPLVRDLLTQIAPGDEVLGAD